MGILREKGDGQPLYPNDCGEMYTLKLHHGGAIYDEGGILSYEGRYASYMDWVDSGYVAFIDLEDIAVDLGYKEKVDIFYNGPGHHVFHLIFSNQEVVEMFNDHDRVRVINIYFCEVPIPLQMHDNDVSEFFFDDMDDPPVEPET
ncbi:hypothetical protein TIFTF001_047907 [Ficus carica]|uniref:PB1-like domain-containing protein n=1 Tax=Ficus carica TaxID=3494 RepID=A0AA87ZKP0_FICCA|nr:hypothetical protein TIFTF001_047907 [Ficus carica]